MKGQAYSSNDDSGREYKLKGHQMSNAWLNPIDAALEAVNAGKYGTSTQAMTALATPSVLFHTNPPGGNSRLLSRSTTEA